MPEPMITCFYDLLHGIHVCNLDGAKWEWPYAAHFRGGVWSSLVSPDWVRANAKKCP